ncbi:MAG: HipA domain-containing protein, partial [Chlorobi bacterium]|nr:HipA domain-containing protein [Chlorobiota bacterium]
MNRCPITYDPCGEQKYSEHGLRMLSRRLRYLEDLPYTAEEQRVEAVRRAAKMSIQGVQPKLSAVLNVARSRFDVVDTGGKYILKPQSLLYMHVPENEDLTMKMAAAAGIEAPLHGMVWSRDGTLTYFIRRFDRTGRKGKLPVEDFAQLSGKTRDTKYQSSMEQVVKIIEEYCTFPLLDKIRLFRLTLFNFLVGNEDMHLKNFSLITRDGKVELSPAYDLLNTTLALGNAAEEIALPLGGKRANLTRRILVDYFARERMALNDV